jgi:hypothetical protein
VDTGADGVHYLLGYIPSETYAQGNFLTRLEEENDAEKKALEEEEGMALRYEQTGKYYPSADDPGDRYSEIGFYKRQTQWVSTYTNYKGVPVNRNEDKEREDGKESDEAYAKRLLDTCGPRKEGESDKDYIKRVTTVFPKIDLVNIQSTGDLYSVAQNHQRIKAKRLDVLVDCENPVYNKAKLDRDELPEGDNVGDDSGLHAGDMHIRGSNRVVMKTGQEILLQVGRTVVSLRDDGLRR